MKKITSAIAIFFILIFILSVPISAAKPYQTYTYSLGGYVLNSPDAYTPIRTVDSDYMGLEKAIDDPRDIIVDKELNVYIADAKNNRIVCLDRYYKLKFTISTFTNENGVADTLASPSGVFVTDDRIFVCDTDKNRIVTFDRKGEFLAVIPEPESTLFEDNSVYKPVALAVDNYNRLYVVSSTTYQGIIVMTDKGEFTSLIGAQKVSISPWDIFYRRFQTDEQRARQKTYIPTEFNNISINENGFIYVTTSSLDEADVQKAIKGKSKSGDYAPVKMLNASGTEIMRRNGFWPPSGEVTVKSRSLNADAGVKGPSRVIDVAMGPEKTWSIIDEKRNKIYTYDYDGNLLFAFGDQGQQLGNLSSIEGIIYQGDLMLVLDKTNDNVTIYQRTEYGNILIQALKYQNETQYDLAVDGWVEILKRNSNFDAAYIGIGQSLARSGEYEEALDYFKSAYDKVNYSDSFKEIRKEWLSKFFLLIPLGVVAIVLIWSLFMKYAKKINTRTAVSTNKRTLKEEFLFVFHLIFHPFDGFWDLKHEKRGSLRAAIIILAITIFSYFYKQIGEGYLIVPGGRYTTIINEAIGVLLPLFLFVVANWCLTTLFDGEGSFKDVLIAVSYSLMPLPLVIIPTTIFSNFTVLEELDILNVIVTFGYIWVGILIFFGMMVTHDYSMGKNILTTIGSLVGIVFIMFIAMLFTTLLSKVYGFVSNIIDEISYRL